MAERIALIQGFRTHIGRMSGKLSSVPAEILGSYIVREVFTRYNDMDDQLSEVIVGNVGSPANAMNIARVIALRAGIDKSVPAYSVHRNCASGLEAITSGAVRILANYSEVILAAGVESMSRTPLLFPNEFKVFLEHFARSKNLMQKLQLLFHFRFSYLKPVIALKLGLTDSVCNLLMGDTAENLAKDFGIFRKEQDEFAMRSHNLAEASSNRGIFAEEVIPYPCQMEKAEMTVIDEGIRMGQNMHDLGKLRPFFDTRNGSVTAGNSSQISDGAAAVILMKESRAKSLGIKPLGYLKDFIYSGLDPSRMGLGPAFAIANLLKKNKLNLSDIDLFEINEAFAVQVLSCVKALDSDQFLQEKLGFPRKVGEIDLAKLNVNGGAIALGHPVGMSGTRIVIHLLRELKRQNKQIGIASLCIGGGQGAAALLEVE